MATAASSLRVRPAAVAGLFYPADRRELETLLDDMLRGEAQPVAPLKALIAPHAGYVYSGPTAAAVYRLLRAQAHDIRDVVIIGPSHRIPFHGVAVPSVDAFATPLGDVRVNGDLRDQLLKLRHVRVADPPHAAEHSLEVQLPFLQHLIDRFTVLPIAAGSASAADIAEVLQSVWGDEHTLIVVSTDLSHYLPYEQARRIDRDTATSITRGAARLQSEQACGYVGLNGMLACAITRGMRIELQDLRNSGDTAGDRERVVGYGAWSMHDA